MAESRRGWAIGAADWSQTLKFISQYEWKKKKFVKQQQRNIENAPGVYMVCASVPEIDGFEVAEVLKNFQTPIYIGHATDLGNRFTQYMTNQDRKLRQAMATFGELNYVYTVMEGASKDLLMLTEQYLLNIFGPSVNVINAMSETRMEKTKESVKATLGEMKPI
ncbi:MAG: hypothetical protein CMH56_10765 [Myxococcales bacterium]|nr:hypothetical protein [Myxococcales bacterium]|tara:strand:+ start:3504 stop:3995 length:492 start_codon:yes stop_codon:yes gene_type:complete